MYFCCFVIISPLDKGVALHLNKLEFPSPKDALCRVCLKLAQCILIRRFLNVVNVFSLFRNYLPLETDMVLHMNKLESPLPNDAFAKFGWNWPLWFRRRKSLQPSSGILAMLDTKPTLLGYRIGVRMCWMQLKFHQQLMTAQIVKVEKVCQRSDFHVVD